MKHTDEQIQAAIDYAFGACPSSRLTTCISGLDWTTEAPFRLAIAEDFLEELEPDPYAELKKAHAEGKVIQSRQRQYGIGSRMWSEWSDEPCPDWSLSNDVEWRIKPEPETFEAHGKTWTRHKAGDAMPCDGEAMVEVVLGHAYPGKIGPAKLRFWDTRPSILYQITGWRFADEQPTPEAPAWTPAVGDVVQLKSGGPKMTVSLLKETLCKCQWFRGDEADLETFEIATLQPVTE